MLKPASFNSRKGNKRRISSYIALFFFFMPHVTSTFLIFHRYRLVAETETAGRKKFNYTLFSGYRQVSHSDPCILFTTYR